MIVGWRVVGGMGDIVATIECMVDFDLYLKDAGRMVCEV